MPKQPTEPEKVPMLGSDAIPTEAVRAVEQLAEQGVEVFSVKSFERAGPRCLACQPEGRRYLTLGTHGFGRSATGAALRGYFEVDAASIVRAARAMG